MQLAIQNNILSRLDLLSVLSSLITGELAQLRHISPLDPIFMGLNPGTEIGNGALGTDSLDLLLLAGVVSEMFHLHETGMEEDLLRQQTLEGWCEIVSISLRKKAEWITFRTSGSTGTARRCVHALQQLQEEAVEHASGLGNCRRVLSMIPSHHIYGFIWTALVPTHLGISHLDVRRWSPSQIALELRRGDLLIGVPANWQFVSRVFDVLAKGIFGVTSGATCPPDLFARIKAAGVDLMEIYGSSETGGVGIRRNASDPFSLLPFWQRVQNVLIRLNSHPAETSLIDTPDDLLWQSERTFRVGPRKDGACQIGGRNVFPERVADVIRAYPAVEDCAIRLMRPEEGHRLKAFIVWRADSSKTERSEKRVMQWLEGKLQPHERPASFTFGDAVPVNTMNKSADWLIKP